MHHLASSSDDQKRAIFSNRMYIVVFGRVLFAYADNTEILCPCCYRRYLKMFLRSIVLPLRSRSSTIMPISCQYYSFTARCPPVPQQSSHYIAVCFKIINPFIFLPFCCLTAVHLPSCRFPLPLLVLAFRRMLRTPPAPVSLPVGFCLVLAAAAAKLSAATAISVTGTRCASFQKCV